MVGDRRQEGEREKEGWSGWEFNMPKSTQSAVSWFRAMYITGLAVHDIV